MKKLIFSFAVCIMIVTGCSKDGDLNVFSVEDDIQLGMQLEQEILNNPDTFPVLERSNYPEAYAYLDMLVSDILSSDDIQYREEFEWNVHIIHDSVLNAFAAPGGYIFIYTGLIEYLEKESHFAGVLAHEIAHADKRHSTDQLTKVYGVSVLLDLLLGENQGLLTDIAFTLTTLKFSRSSEEEADEFSVIYLCDTEYAADGAAGFFERLEEMGAASPPEFLSTHPSPENRVQDIKMTAAERMCDTTNMGSINDWEEFQAALP